MRTTASVSLTSVPSFSKRTRFRIRSKIAASSAAFAFWLKGATGACGEASVLIKTICRVTRELMDKIPGAVRKKRRDILQFFYAVRSVKSNHPYERHQGNQRFTCRCRVALSGRIRGLRCAARADASAGCDGSNSSLDGARYRISFSLAC